MLDVWLIPALFVLACAVAMFYLVVKFTGGTGVRTAGRTVHDKQQEEDNLPPG